MKPTPGAESTSGGEFIAASRTVLAHDYVPKLHRALDLVTDDDVWWRPNDASNAIGNMILHMAGNLEQWIVGGAGGRAISRDRDAEFRARDGLTRDALRGLIDETVSRVDRVLADIPETTLVDRITVQGFHVTRLHAVYHSIEHFGYHLGQVAYVAKLRTGKDMGIFP